MRVTDVHAWALEAEVGDTAIYQRSQPGASGSAMRASDDGLVFLSQRRMGPDVYEYRATRVSARTAAILGILPEDKLRSLGGCAPVPVSHRLALAAAR